MVVPTQYGAGALRNPRSMIRLAHDNAGRVRHSGVIGRGQRGARRKSHLEGVNVDNDWGDDLQEEYFWEDDLYQYNLAEADDYRNEDSDWEDSDGE